MGEVVNVVVAIVVIVFLYRWATSSSDSSPNATARSVLGFRPKPATPEMVQTIQTMFPDIPPDHIRYDLLRTGSVELTSHKLLEQGFLDPPPPGYYRLFPNLPQTEAGQQAARPVPPPGESSKGKKSLIARYNLESRLRNEKEASITITEPTEAGGKAVWENTPEQREASLRERKAQMVLAARQRMLAAQQKESSES